MESVFGQQYYKQHLTGLFPNGNWVILGLDSEMPGSVGRDSITIHLLNTQVDLLSQIPVQPPRNFESFELKNVLITSDSTFAIAYAGGDCDACCYMSYLDGYSINGELIWRHEIDEYADLGRTCFVNDEKNISILYPKSLTTYSGATGEELSSYTVVEDYPDGVIKVPGVDEMIVLAYPNVRVLRFNATIDEYEIILEIPSAEIGNYLEAHWQGQDYFYALDYPTSIVRVYRDLRIETIATFEGFLTDFTVKDDTIYILDEENYNQYNIIRLERGIDSKMSLIRNFWGAEPVICCKVKNSIEPKRWNRLMAIIFHLYLKITTFKIVQVTHDVRASAVISVYLQIRIPIYTNNL